MVRGLAPAKRRGDGRWPALALACLGLAARGRVALALEPGLRLDQYARTAWPSVAHASEMDALFLSPSGHLWIGTSDADP
jgi:hypothetical protein